MSKKRIFLILLVLTLSLLARVATFANRNLPSAQHFDGGSSSVISALFGFGDQLSPLNSEFPGTGIKVNASSLAKLFFETKESKAFPTPEMKKQNSGNLSDYTSRVVPTPSRPPALASHRYV